MNFVVISFCFPPMADPESYCTARFVSALAAAGHHVQVVVPDNPPGMPESTYAKLVDSRVSVIKVPVSAPAKKPFWSRIRYMTTSWRTADFPAFIATLKSILEQTPDAVLVSRTLPMDSLIVADCCRMFAKKWVFHISDPISCRFVAGSSVKNTMQTWATRFWLKRAFHHADAFSVTCENAIKYYREALGAIVDSKPIFVTTHIGDFAFRSETSADDIVAAPYKGKTIVHPGELHVQRGGRAILETVDRLNDRGFACTFVQAGHVNKSMVPLMKTAKHSVVFDKESIGNAVSATQLADVVFVPDYSVGNRYSGTLMSKFVYQVYEDKPIVVYSLWDSAKRRYAEKYPEAGIFWADSAQPKSLDVAIEKALECDVSRIDRSRIREEFSARTIAGGFVENVASLDRA